MVGVNRFVARTRTSLFPLGGTQIYYNRTVALIHNFSKPSTICSTGALSNLLWRLLTLALLTEILWVSRQQVTRRFTYSLIYLPHPSIWAERSSASLFSLSFPLSFLCTLHIDSYRNKRITIRLSNHRFLTPVLVIKYKAWGKIIMQWHLLNCYRAR